MRRSEGFCQSHSSHKGKRQQPGQARTIDARLKLHLHRVQLGTSIYRVLVPRRGTQVRFSAHYFHDTWHIVSSQRGAQFLARVLRGLSYQRQENTLVYLAGEFLAPTPFEAEPSDPIVLINAHLTPLKSRHFAQLRQKMKQSVAPQNTVRCLTFGLDQALEAMREAQDNAIGYRVDYRFFEQKFPWWKNYRSQSDPREVMRRVGGCVCYAAPNDVLRRQALIVARLDADRYECGMDYHYLSDHRHLYSGYYSADGEIQIFKSYDAMLRDAQTARCEIEAKQGQVTTLEDDRLQVQNQTQLVRERRTRAHRKGALEN